MSRRLWTAATGLLLLLLVSVNLAAGERFFEECGVTVPERDDAFPKIGECALETTGDPRVFGPDAWRTFHRFAQNFPETPNKEAYEACLHFIYALPYMLPCTLCGLDLMNFVRNNIIHSGTFDKICSASEEYNMPCQSPEIACSAGSLLVNFFLRAHHTVDSHTQPCKTLWSPAQAAQVYSFENLCAKNIVWGKCGKTGLCRTDGQLNCVATPDCPNATSPSPPSPSSSGGSSSSGSSSGDVPRRAGLKRERQYVSDILGSRKG